MQLTHELNIPSKDLRTIEELTREYPQEDYGFLLTMLRVIFRHDIKPGHYTWLGYLIGERVATERNATHKSNFNLQCLSSN